MNALLTFFFIVPLCRNGGELGNTQGNMEWLLPWECEQWVDGSKQYAFNTIPLSGYVEFIPNDTAIEDCSQLRVGTSTGIQTVHGCMFIGDRGEVKTAGHSGTIYTSEAAPQRILKVEKNTLLVDLVFKRYPKFPPPEPQYTLVQSDTSGNSVCGIYPGAYTYRLRIPESSSAHDPDGNIIQKWEVPGFGCRSKPYEYIHISSLSAGTSSTNTAHERMPAYAIVFIVCGSVAIAAVLVCIWWRWSTVKSRGYEQIENGKKVKTTKRIKP